MRAAILVVEDDPDSCAQILTLLEGEGYAVDTAADGYAAMTYLRSRPPPRLVLLNLAIAADDGWLFLTARRADAALARVPVVALSDDGQSLRAAAVALGAAGLLVKPVDAAALLVTASRYR
jgi:CheY-like chemotaxis protein